MTPVPCASAPLSVLSSGKQLICAYCNQTVIRSTYMYGRYTKWEEAPGGVAPSGTWHWLGRASAGRRVPRCLDSQNRSHNDHTIYTIITHTAATSVPDRLHTVRWVWSKLRRHKRCSRPDRGGPCAAALPLKAWQAMRLLRPRQPMCPLPPCAPDRAAQFADRNGSCSCIEGRDGGGTA